MKIGDKGLQMKSGPHAGKVIQFSSSAKRDHFEKVAAAYSNGWKGPK